MRQLHLIIGLMIIGGCNSEGILPGAYIASDDDDDTYIASDDDDDTVADDDDDTVADDDDDDTVADDDDDTTPVADYPYDEGLRVRLIWEGPGDFDLHLTNPAMPLVWDTPDNDGNGLPDPWFNMSADCHFQSIAPEWGDELAKRPFFQIDVLEAPGGESILFEEPGPQEYMVGVNGYVRTPPAWTGFTGVRVTTYWDGYEVASVTETLVAGDLWCAALMDANGMLSPCPIGIVPDYDYYRP